MVNGYKCPLGLNFLQFNRNLQISLFIPIFTKIIGFKAMEVVKAKSAAIYAKTEVSLSKSQAIDSNKAIQIKNIGT